MDILNTPVLVLNKGWTPIHIKSAKDAICDVVAECAEIIDTNCEFLTTYKWANQKDGTPGWASLPVPEGAKAVHTSKAAIRLPEVIVLKDYNEIPDMEIRLTRRNLLLRDNFCCQYCGKKVTNSTFTIDHVMPRSRGGPNSWENFVVACFPCNIKKRDRTPKEAGIVLKSKPSKPNWYPLATRFGPSAPESWSRFLSKSKLPQLSF